MSADRIDVLAVMDAADDFIARVNGDDRPGSPSLAEARAAVAELIEAVRETQKMDASGPHSRAVWEAAYQRVDAALARVGGAP